MPTRKVVGSTTSATDELRRLLDERGVEHYDGTECTLWGYEQTSDSTGCYRCAADESGEGFMTLRMHHITPAQAIAATLGSDDTFTREDVEGAFVSGYSLGLDMFDNSKPDNEKGWNQNERDMDEEMEDLGWVRKDAATLGARTCEADETDLIPFVRADSGDLDVDYIHVKECNKCGGTYEHVNGSYEFCPRCGEVVGE